jgi:hypothetical protein
MKVILGVKVAIMATPSTTVFGGGVVIGKMVVMVAMLVGKPPCGGSKGFCYGTVSGRGWLGFL